MSKELQLDALKNISSNIMIADANRKIVYMNKAVTEFLRKAESAIQKDLPHFKVDDLVGQNIDIFHKKPEHQKTMLNAMKDKYTATISVGGQMFDLKAGPIFGRNGKMQIYGYRTRTTPHSTTRFPDPRPSSNFARREPY